ncbi:MAG: hypothetical protein PVJ68_02695, partial [Candidatus Thiodiazotropha sp.]
KWKPEEGVAYRDFASEAGGEAKFVVNDEILTASTGGMPIHEPGKDDYVDITPYPNREDHDTTTTSYPMAEQDKDSHILSNPLPGEKLPWRTETPAERMDEPTVMMNEESDNASIDGTGDVVQSEDVDQARQLASLELSERHILGNFSIPKKTGNTLFLGTKQEAIKDLAEIQEGKAVREGELFTVSSGRVWGKHNTSIYPVSGPNVVDVTSAEYNILVQAQKQGTDRAIQTLEHMTNKLILNAEQYQRTMDVISMIEKLTK